MGLARGGGGEADARGLGLIARTAPAVLVALGDVAVVGAACAEQHLRAEGLHLLWSARIEQHVLEELLDRAAADLALDHLILRGGEKAAVAACEHRHFLERRFIVP